MQFYEKLIFVMNLTQTTNRELALAAQVDPSIISRFRSGKRGLPRNLELLRSMSDFLAERCTGEYQRRALSETSKNSCRNFYFAGCAVTMTEWTASCEALNR